MKLLLLFPDDLTGNKGSFRAIPKGGVWKRCSAFLSLSSPHGGKGAAVVGSGHCSIHMGQDTETWFCSAGMLLIIWAHSQMP